MAEAELATTFQGLVSPLEECLLQRSGGGDGALARKLAKNHPAIVGQASSSQ